MLSLWLPACREQLFFWTRCSMQRISIFMCRKPIALSWVERVSGSLMLARTTLWTRGMWWWGKDMLGPWLGMMSWVFLFDCSRLLHLFCFLKYLLCDCLWNSIVNIHYRKSVDMSSVGKRCAGWGTGSSLLPLLISTWLLISVDTTLCDQCEITVGESVRLL